MDREIVERGRGKLKNIGLGTDKNTGGGGINKKIH